MEIDIRAHVGQADFDEYFSLRKRIAGAIIRVGRAVRGLLPYRELDYIDPEQGNSRGIVGAPDNPGDLEMAFLGKTFRHADGVDYVPVYCDDYCENYTVLVPVSWLLMTDAELDALCAKLREEKEERERKRKEDEAASKEKSYKEQLDADYRKYLELKKRFEGR